MTQPSIRFEVPVAHSPQTSDPTGTWPEGSTYWNSSLGLQRTFHNGAWQNTSPGTGGGGGVPAGAAVMTDSMTAKVNYIANETITQSDSQTYAIAATYAETNAAQTDSLRANVAGPGFNEVNATQGDTMTARLVFTSSSTFTPSRATTYTVECRGAGAGGAKGTGTGGTGGNGGDDAISALSLTSGTAYTVTVGAAGAANSGVGGDSWFGSTTTVLAKGGGSASTTVGTTKSTGGTGVAGTLLGAGGAGGAGANGGGAGGASGAAGTAPGGGGGGGTGSLTAPGNGGAGGQGQVIITWAAA